MKRNEAERLLKQFKGRLAIVRDDKKKLRVLQAKALRLSSPDDVLPPEKMNHSMNYIMFRDACVEEQILLQEIKILERLLTRD